MILSVKKIILEPDSLFRYFCFIFLVFTFTVFELKSQFRDTGLINRIDSSLKIDEMKLSDIWLPEDYVLKDHYRLTGISQLFEKPLNSNLAAEEINDIFKAKDSELTSKDIDKLLKIIKYKKFSQIDFDDFMANDMVNKSIGIDIDSAFGYPASLIVKQYLIPVIKASKTFERDILFSNNANIRFLKKYADSIIYRQGTLPDNPYSYSDAVKRYDDNAEMFFDYAKIADETNVFNIGFSLYLHLLKVNSITLSNISELKSQIKTKIVESNFGRIAIGGVGNDEYKGNFFMIIDLGGNDKYNLDDIPKALALITPVTALIDFSGNDIYKSGDYTLGGGYFGINLLVDYSGDDTYSAGNNTLGSACFGLGILHDYAGNDSYNGKNFSLGAGAFGIGLLIDENGKDAYSSGSFSQGFGFTRGFGFLGDKNGNDSYNSSGKNSKESSNKNILNTFTQGAALGYKPLASGGYGFLADYSGDDTYISDLFSQGSAFWFGFGNLSDYSGNDRYNSNIFSQGSGVSFSFGNLTDYKGNDNYFSSAFSQGSGYDIAFGSLYDIEGNDRYNIENQISKSTDDIFFSLLFDMKGDDTYLNRILKSRNESVQKKNHSNRKYIYFDDSGKNSFLDSGNNTKFQYIPNLNKLTDYNNHFYITQNSGNLEKVINFKMPLNIDSIFTLAISNSELYRNYIIEARDSLIKNGEKSALLLLSKLKSYDNQRLEIIENIFAKMLQDKDSLQIKSLIIDSLNSTNRANFGMFSRLLSDKFPDFAKQYLLLRLDDTDWQIRLLAVKALGKNDSPVVTTNLFFLLNDKHPLIRAEAAKVIGRVKNDGYLAKLQTCFTDSCQIVRNSAYDAVLSNLEPDFIFAKELLSGDFSLPVKKKFITPLVNLDLKDKELKEFVSLINNQDADLKKDFYKEITSKKNSSWKHKLHLFIKNEPDLQLKKILRND